MKYNKLVRDNIPDIIRKKGGVPKTHIAGEAEYWEKLKEKLSEEVAEFQKDENEEELADVLEVIDAIIAHKQFQHEHIMLLKHAKLEERGGFKEKIILEES